MNKERLLNVAKALRESPNPKQFYMGTFGYDCGTPACALGHYAARGDLQDVLSLDAGGDLADARGNYLLEGWNDVIVRQHFDLSYNELNQLFSPFGCGEPDTAIEAAEYIESFVAGRP